jgi:hypothetical protein
MAVDTQHRGKVGEISREHGNALIGALRKTVTRAGTAPNAKR